MMWKDNQIHQEGGAGSAGEGGANSPLVTWERFQEKKQDVRSYQRWVKRTCGKSQEGEEMVQNYEVLNSLHRLVESSEWKKKKIMLHYVNWEVNLLIIGAFLDLFKHLRVFLISLKSC